MTKKVDPSLKSHSLYCRFCKCVVFVPCREESIAKRCPVAADARHYMATGESKIDRILRHARAHG